MRFSFFKTVAVLSVALFLSLSATGHVQAQTPSTPATAPEKEKKAGKPAKKRSLPVARIETEKGVIVIEMYPEEAPKTVQNFLALAKKGFYNGLTFHRVEPGFVVQGGDPKGDGSGDAGYNIPNERNKNLSHLVGAVGMANAGPNTAGSQFYIIISKPAPALDNGQYTLFGRVVEGQDVAEKLAKGDKMTRVTVEEPEGFKIGPTKDAEVEYTVPVTLPENAAEFKSGIRVKITIEPDGKTAVELTRKSGNKVVDQATVEALLAWKWLPALRNGDPVRSTQQFDYDIRNGSRTYKR